MIRSNGVALAEDPARLVQILQAAAYKNDPTLGGDPFYVRLLAEDVGTGLITAATYSGPRNLHNETTRVR